MFKTGDKKPSVRLNDDLADLLEAVAIPAAEVGGVSAEVQKKIGVSRMLDLFPRLFNIGVADINELPADKRKALMDALNKYFEVMGRLRAPGAPASSVDAIGDATKAVNRLIAGYRGAINATVKSPELLAVLRPAYLKPRTLEFTGQRLTALYAMHLADIDGLAPGDRTAVVEPFGNVLQTDEARGDSSSIGIAQGYIEYGGNYYYDMRSVTRDLEHALLAAGLLTKPVLDLMRKAGHDRVRDLVLHERNVTAPMLARSLKDKTDAERSAVYGAMEAYVLSGKLTGDEAKRFDAQVHKLEISA